MSRAFLKELDGWNYCRSRHRECSDAAFSGRCERAACKYETAGPKESPGTDPEKKTTRDAAD